MPRGVRNEDFSEEEKWKIAEKYRATNMRATRTFVRDVLDGHKNPNPRRDLKAVLRTDSTVRKWVAKMEQGIAPHDDRRR